MGGAGVDRPPSLICPRASAWRAALLPSLHGERLALMCRGSRSLRGEQRPGKTERRSRWQQGVHWMQWGENPFGFGNPFRAGYATYMRAVNPNWARTATAIRTACRMAALHLDSPPLARRTEHPAGPSETCWSPLVGDGRAAMGSPRPNASPRPIFPPVGLGSQRQILQDRISNEINRIPDGRFDNGP